MGSINLDSTEQDSQRWTAHAPVGESCIGLSGGAGASARSL